MKTKLLKAFRKRFGYYFTERKYKGEDYIGVIIVDKKTMEVHFIDHKLIKGKLDKNLSVNEYMSRHLSYFILRHFDRDVKQVLFRETKKYWLHKDKKTKK